MYREIQIKSLRISVIILLFLILYMCNILVVSCQPLGASTSLTPGALAATPAGAIVTENEDDDETLFIRTYDSLSDKERNQVEKCEQNLTLMELCMRCAKETKHPYIYPMCCGDEAKMVNFCEDYVYFGA